MLSIFYSFVTEKKKKHRVLSVLLQRPGSAESNEGDFKSPHSSKSWDVFERLNFHNAELKVNCD